MSGVRDKEHDDDRVFKALASPARRRMLDALRASTHTTGSLCAAVPELDRTTVLQHLRVLEAAGLVTGRKVGRERHLSLAPLPIKRIHDRWISGYTRAAVELLAELDAGAGPLQPDGQDRARRTRPRRGSTGPSRSGDVG